MENTKDLLVEVIEDQLEKAKGNYGGTVEEKQKNFDNAMKATDRLIKIMEIESEENRNEANREVEMLKLEQSKEVELLKMNQNSDDQKKNLIIKMVEVAAVPTVLFISDCLFKRYYMRSVCNFEKDYTFTTTPGRSVSNLFRFKK